MILLGKNPGMVQTNANVEISPEIKQDEYLLSSVLKRARIIERIPEVVETEFIKMNTDVALTKVQESRDFSDRSIIPSTSGREMSENDGLVYIAGYLAKKMLRNIHTLVDIHTKLKKPLLYIITTFHPGFKVCHLVA
uniref:Transposable element P transposase-like C-terminal domain-containing protein n=1 Tax=Photinus pyralis TaxID=7054 RepID=A0A1Y1JYN8_PHOPY